MKARVAAAETASDEPASLEVLVLVAACNEFQEAADSSKPAERDAALPPRDSDSPPVQVENSY